MTLVLGEGPLSVATAFPSYWWEFSDLNAQKAAHHKA
jgi:hypothetical protein